MKMNSNPNDSQLPVRSDSNDVRTQPENDLQAVMGYLPQTGRIEADERILMAQEEDYDPLAIQLALKPQTYSAADKLRLFIFILVAAG